MRGAPRGTCVEPRGTCVEPRSVLVALVACALALATSGCCCFAGGSGGGGGGGAPPPVYDQTDTSVRHALESHLHSDEAYGDTPEAELAARAVLRVVDRGDAVVAMQLGTVQPRLVVLVQYDDDDGDGLIDMEYDERQDDLSTMLAAIDATLPSAVTQEVVVAIRGDWFYGAMVTRRVGEPPRYETEEALDTDQLDRMLTHPPEPPPPIAPLPPPTTQQAPTPPP